ncbi:Arylsulfatase [Pirellulimonas nuda]|uniref:Arylsulfatase n=1 Tax=Pirellulimonas nuda TaxID=2528009 RepID=A0A518D5G2_9BACT|nr:sulfatase-like hydrolase/transferase [Pirellulimonas nuda]QDU86717.1 Arylsulfatase [Pirellulimonas nuda]
MKTLSLLAVVAALWSPAVHAAPRPSVVIIVADDLGYADLAFLPQAPPDVRAMGTPGLDRLAARGVYFSDAYATAPICSPSRCGLITGRYQQRWGNYWFGDGGLPKGETTLAQRLRALGYATKKVGKTHLNGGPAEHPLDHGFDEFLGFRHHTWDYLRLTHADREAYEQRAAGRPLGILNVGPLERGRGEPAEFPDGFTTDVFSDEAVEFIARERGEQPFYLQLEYNAVHAPTYIASPKYAARVGFTQPAWDRDAPRWRFPYWDPNEVGWEKWHRRWGHLDAIDTLGRKRYLSQLMALDAGVGRVLDTLEARGVLDDTIVVLLSDNGGEGNNYSINAPLSGTKYMFGEGGIRVPMIVTGPGFPAGDTCGALVSAMDLVPTVLEVLGEPAAAELDGGSLVGVVQTPTASAGHDELCWSNGRQTGVIRRGKWKLAMNAGWNHSTFTLVDGFAQRGEPYAYPDGDVLFDLESDIGETRNLADDHPQVVAELKAAYQQWRASMSNPRTPSGKLRGKSGG